MVITVTIGEQTFTPVPYNTFKVGPFSMTVEVSLFSTVEETYERVHAQLLEIARKAYSIERNLYYDRIEGRDK